MAEKLESLSLLVGFLDNEDEVSSYVGVRAAVSVFLPVFGSCLSSILCLELHPIDGASLPEDHLNTKCQLAWYVGAVGKHCGLDFPGAHLR